MISRTKYKSTKAHLNIVSNIKEDQNWKVSDNSITVTLSVDPT